MGFLDKAKAAATELAAKADGALAQAGLTPSTGGGREADRLLRDLGVLAYNEASGKAADAAARDRVLAALRGLESSGQLGSLTLSDQLNPSAPPPPPGAVAAANAAPPPPPPPGAAAVPPPPPPPAPAEAAPTSSGGGTVAPPPPPSWASNS